MDFIANTVENLYLFFRMCWTLHAAQRHSFVGHGKAWQQNWSSGMQTRMYACMHVCMYVFMYVCKYVYIYISPSLSASEDMREEWEHGWQGVVIDRRDGDGKGKRSVMNFTDSFFLFSRPLLTVPL